MAVLERLVIESQSTCVDEQDKPRENVVIRGLREQEGQKAGNVNAERSFICQSKNAVEPTGKVNDQSYYPDLITYSR